MNNPASDVLMPALDLPYQAALSADIPRRSVTSEQNTIVRVKNLHKNFQRGASLIPVLRGVNLQVRAGEFLAIAGQSGSGKSTLLHLLSALDAPDKGTIQFAGRDLTTVSARERDKIRNRDCGIIFQFYHLLPELSALENVLMSKLIEFGVLAFWSRRREFEQQAENLLERVGLAHRAKHRPSELSGGEMQRVAIARALMPRPRVLFADEPTGNLDQQTGSAIMEVLRGLHQQDGLTIVLVTHDHTIAGQADRCIKLVEGIVEEG